MTGKKRKSKGGTNKRGGKVVESDTTEEEEMQPMYETEDEADALPVIAPTVPDFMEYAQGNIVDPSAPSSKKRKLVAEVVISTPSPRKKAKVSRKSGSLEI